MIYDDNFFSNLPEDPREALRAVAIPIANHYAENEDNHNGLYNAKDQYYEAFGYSKASIEEYEFNYQTPGLVNDTVSSLRAIGDFFISLIDRIDSDVRHFTIEGHKERFSSLFAGSFIYEFPDDDFKHIQELINVLREEIQKCELLEDEHRERLLKKLENLQKEFHKKMSSLDKFFGLLSDAGFVLGKFGDDVKSLTDPIFEIVKIALKISNVSEGLPMNMSLPLPKLDTEDEDGDKNDD